jgi:hypothetical protein
METLMTYIPLANFLLVFLIIPTVKLLNASQAAIRNQQKEIEELKKIVSQQGEELKLLRLLVMKHLPPEDIKQYMMEITK